MPGPLPSSRRRTPSLNDAQHQSEGLDTASSARSAVSSRTRRRPSRTHSYDDSPPHSASPSWVDEDRQPSKRSKAGRNTLKKSARRDSLYSDTPTRPYYHEHEDTGGFVPKLSQIREGKKSRSSRSRTGSTVSSTAEPRLRRRRTADDAVTEPPFRHKYDRQRHGSSIARHPSPSIISVVSDLTQNSDLSLGSNTTITQRSFDDESFVSEQDPLPEAPDPRDSQSSRNMAASQPDKAQANVFQFMQPVPTVEEYSDEESHDEEASTSASSSDGSEHAETLSSNAGSSYAPADTPTTSPVSSRRSNLEAPFPPSRKQRQPGKPLYASSFVHGHGGDDAEEEDEEEEENEDEYSDESESEHGKEHHGDTDGHQHHLADDRALPRVPSRSSRTSDPHTRRLRQQELELANHVLQSPQPQKDFQFAGEPSPHPHAAMPLYSPNAYSGATPANFEPTAGQPPEWHMFPPPLPITYLNQATIEHPPMGQPLPLAVQPPMGVPSLQQHGPPYPQYPGQPPQYQTQVPGSELTRTTAAGYELLANKLSDAPQKGKAVRKSGQLVPMYRKFEHLNHRVLLHLQDEVCELEEELRHLDESIMQLSPRDESGHPFPASRRGDARYGSELHYKRTELLGRIFQKIGQYSKCYPTTLSLRADVMPLGRHIHDEQVVTDSVQTKP